MINFNLEFYTPAEKKPDVGRKLYILILNNKYWPIPMIGEYEVRTDDHYD